MDADRRFVEIAGGYLVNRNGEPGEVRANMPIKRQSSPNTETLDEPGGDQVKLGAYLKSLRETMERRPTQGTLARSLLLGRTTVSNAENGRNITAGIVGKYVKLFPAAEDELLTLLKALPPVERRSRTGSSQADQEADEDEVAVLFRTRTTRDIAIAGDWYALWETTVDDSELLNRERLVLLTRRNGLVTLRNEAVSPDNLEGGYLWAAEGRLFDNQYLLCTYISRESSVRSKGCLYLVLHQSGKHFTGQWVGCNYDGDWASGLVVIARKDEGLDRLLSRHRGRQPKLPYTRTMKEGLGHE